VSQEAQVTGKKYQPEKRKEAILVSKNSDIMKYKRSRSKVQCILNRKGKWTVEV